jgi:predicted ester cyclase
MLLQETTAVLDGYHNNHDMNATTTIMKDKKQMVKDFYEQVVSGNHTNQVARYIDSGCVARNGETVIFSGVKGMQEHISGVKATYPDLKIRVLRQFSDDDFVISEIIAEGTHLGERLGIKQSGKKLTFTAVNIDRIWNEKIVEHGGAANIFDTFWAEKIIHG